MLMPIISIFSGIVSFLRKSGWLVAILALYLTACVERPKPMAKRIEGSVVQPSPTPVQTKTPDPENMNDFCKIDPTYCRAAQDKFETYRQNARDKAKDIKDGIELVEQFIQSKPELESAEQKENLKILDGLASKIKNSSLNLNMLAETDPFDTFWTLADDVQLQLDAAWEIVENLKIKPESKINSKEIELTSKFTTILVSTTPARPNCIISENLRMHIASEPKNTEHNPAQSLVKLRWLLPRCHLFEGFILTKHWNSSVKK